MYTLISPEEMDGLTTIRLKGYIDTRRGPLKSVGVIIKLFKEEVCFDDKYKYRYTNTNILEKKEKNKVKRRLKYIMKS